MGLGSALWQEGLIWLGRTRRGMQYPIRAGNAKPWFYFIFCGAGDTQAIQSAGALSSWLAANIPKEVVRVPREGRVPKATLKYLSGKNMSDSVVRVK